MDIFQPVSDVKQIHASLAEDAVEARSTEITSSTQLVDGTAHNDAMTSEAHSGYRLKFRGALIPPNSWLNVLKYAGHCMCGSCWHTTKSSIWFGELGTCLNALL